MPEPLTIVYIVLGLFAAFLGWRWYQTRGNKGGSRPKKPGPHDLPK